MKKFISPQKIKDINYYKTHAINYGNSSPMRITESAKSTDAIKFSKSLIENWKNISSDPEVALYEISNRLEDIYNTQASIIKDQIISCMHKNILPFVSDDTLSKICTQNQSKFLLDLSESVDEYIYYNKLVHNYDKLNKSCNFSKLLESQKTTINSSVLDSKQKRDSICTILEIARSSYKDVPAKALYYIMAESLLFGCIVKKYTNISSKEILEVTTDYFSLNTDITPVETEDVLNKLNMFSNDDKQELLDLFNEQEQKSLGNGLKVRVQNNISEIISRFKIAKEKNKVTFEDMMTKIYAKPLENIVDESYNIFDVIHTFAVLGTATLSPALAAITGIVVFCIKRDMDIKNTDKMLKSLEKSKEKSEKRLEKLKDKDLIKAEQDIIDEIDKNIKAVKEYRYKIQTDKENEKDLEEFCRLDAPKQSVYFLVTESIMNKFSDEKTIQESVIDLEYLTEGDIMRSIKLAQQSLISKAKKLSTKEKAMSDQMDKRINDFVVKTERGMALKKREQVIKGQTLPSFSNILKMAIASGAAFLVNPAIAAVGVLSAIAVSKKATIKEKQYILDEIEVQLKICERRIAQAEMKGDEDNLADLYRLQARLTKERHRIKFNMKSYHEPVGSFNAPTK